MWVKVQLVIKVPVVVAVFTSDPSFSPRSVYSLSFHIALHTYYVAYMLVLVLSDLLMSFSQTSLQLIKVKQNSHFRGQEGIMKDSEKCKDAIISFTSLSSACV